jgi:hypothetical protein
MKAFLSHSSADNALATRLFRFMRDQAVDVWFNRIELRPGDSLLGEIGAGIESADFLLALLTEKSVASPWVQKELTIALNRELSGEKPRVIPLVVEPCSAPTIVSDKLYLSIRSDQADFPDLIPALFRDSFILDLPLSRDFTLDRESLRKELYEFTRSKFTSLQARIANHGFNEKVKEICARTVAEVSQGQDSYKESVVRQIKGISNEFDIHLPLFWPNVAGSENAEAMIDVELVGDQQRRIADTRFLAPSSTIDLEILPLVPSPVTEIFDTTWYEVCVPQIIVRNLIWTVYALGKPLHELDYALGLAPTDYTRMGLA